MFKTLAYHLIDDRMPRHDLTKSRMYVSERMFEKHLRQLKDAGFRFIDLEEAERQLLMGAESAGQNVLLTFDDGYQNTIEKALPILERNQVPATISVCGSYIDPRTRVNIGMHADKRFADENQMRKWLDAGNTILAHTYSHFKLTRISEAECEMELTKDLEAIQSFFHIRPRGVVYPYGSVNEQVIEIVRRYFDYGFATDMGMKTSAENRYRLKRICAENDCSAESILEQLYKEI